MNPRELLEAAVNDCGHHETTLRAMLRAVGWGPTRLAQELHVVGWLERLRDAIAERGVEQSVQFIGPIGAAQLSEADSVTLMTAKLRRAVAEYDGGPALLLGSTGTGKTLAARAMARKLGRIWAHEKLARERHRLDEPESSIVDLRIAWANANDLALAVARHPLGRGAPDEMRCAREYPLVVLDDLTWPQRDDTTLEVLGARYDAGLPTIATAGCTRAELVARFGDAVVRRLLICRGKHGILVEEFSK